MKTLTVGNKNETVFVGESYLNLRKYLPTDRQTVLLTDSNVYAHYKNFINQYEHIVIPDGESSKEWNTIAYITEELIKINADRHTFLIGFGGGVITDITGFVASIFMRGIDFGFISSSLLSQVDASIGGKNGINFKGYKNLLGCFTLPQFVICDLELLKTLPKNQLRNGFGELLKHAIIKDKNLFKELLETSSTLLAGENLDLITKVVHRSLEIKATVVNNDFLEKGERRVLNFGHTFAHAIENNSNLLHGEAVAVGMAIAARLSHRKGWLSSTEKDEVIALIQKYKLPTNYSIAPEILFDFLKKDKKKKGDAIDFVFLRAIGQTKIEKISFTELFNFIKKDLV